MYISVMWAETPLDKEKKAHYQMNRYKKLNPQRNALQMNPFC